MKKEGGETLFRPKEAQVKGHSKKLPVLADLVDSKFPGNLIKIQIFLSPISPPLNQYL